MPSKNLSQLSTDIKNYLTKYGWKETVKAVGPIVGVAGVAATLAIFLPPAVLISIAGTTVGNELCSFVKDWICKKFKIKKVDNLEIYGEKLSKEEFEELANILKRKILGRIGEEEFANGIKKLLKNEELKTVFKDIIGEEVDKILEDMERLHREHQEILQEIRKCGLRDFEGIFNKAKKVNFEDVFENFKRTAKRLPPEELVCVIENDGTIERDIEFDILKKINNGKNILILGISSSGKSVLLMRLCYKLYLQGWEVFFTDEKIDSQRAREYLERVTGKKVVVIDNAAKYDEYFDFIRNARSEIRIIMAEQDIYWKNKKRGVSGYNFDELKLSMTRKEGMCYINKFGGSEKLLNEGKIFPILILLVTEGKESFNKIVDDIWNNLDKKEKEVAYPIFVVSSLNLGYPQKLFYEIYDSYHIIEELKDKNVISIRENKIYTPHPSISRAIISKSMKNKKYEEIKKLLEKLEEKNTEEIRKYYNFLFNIGYALEMDEKNKNSLFFASSFFNLCLKIKPNDDNAWYNRGWALDNLRKYDEAMKCYDKAIEINPANDAAWNSKGLVFKEIGKYNKAMKCFDKAIEINPANDAAWNSKGLVFKEIGKYDKAMKCFDKAIEINPANDAAWDNRGNTFKASGKYAEAMKCYDKAIEINPTNDWAWFNKGNTFKASGKYAEAMKCYDKAIEVNPTNDWAWVHKGLVFQGIGKYDKAMKCYDKAIEIDSNNAKAWNNRGNIFEASGKYDEAMKCYDKAIEIDPNYAKAWNNKGVVFQRIRKYDEAMKCYDKAIEIDPNYAKAWNNKREVFEKIHRNKRNE